MARSAVLVAALAWWLRRERVALARALRERDERLDRELRLFVREYTRWGNQLVDDVQRAVRGSA